MTNITEPKANGFALIPFGIFLCFYLGISIFAKDFYAVPMPIAFLVASAVAIYMNRKEKISEKVEVFAQGMGENNIMIMCLIFILAGAFAKIAQASGSVDAAVRISRHWVPDSLILPEFFLISCFISLAIGTSCGTIAAIAPIAIGMLGVVEIPPALLLGSVVGGAMFGDNMSMISDTTIAATRTQNVAMKDKFLTNLKMIFPAALICLIIYFFIGRTEITSSSLPEISWRDLFLLIPYLVILFGALAGANVMLLLFLGIILSVSVGIIFDKLSFFACLKAAGDGSLGMAETLIVALLAGGLLNIIRYNGGIKWLLQLIEKNMNQAKTCEFGIMLLVGAVNIFTANNTVAIVVAGPIAKELSDKFNCNPKRIASILDTASCVVQGLLPYGAQILIAIGIAKSANLQISSIELLTSIYYPMLLGGILILSIFFSANKK